MTATALSACLAVGLSLAACGPPPPRAAHIPLLPALGAPRFELPDAPAEAWLGTGPVQRQDLLGKVVLIELWAYQCEWCDRTHAWVRDLARRYGPRLVILGVHSPQSRAGQQPDVVAAYARAQAMRWPIYFDRELAVMDRLQAQGWPTLFLLDWTGRVRLSTLGYAQSGSPRARGIEADIDALLAERAEP